VKSGFSDDTIVLLLFIISLISGGSLIHMGFCRLPVASHLTQRSFLFFELPWSDLVH